MVSNASISTTSASISELPPCVCRVCGNQHLHRLARAGFLQKQIFPLFGFYPWECFVCRKTRLFRARGKRVFKRIWDDEILFSTEESQLPASDPQNVVTDGELRDAASSRLAE